MSSASTNGSTPWELHSKEKRIQQHLKEFTDEELTELLINGKTMYGPESELDTETDIADEMQNELDYRRYLRNHKRRLRVIEHTDLKRTGRSLLRTIEIARRAAHRYGIKRGFRSNQWGAFS